MDERIPRRDTAKEAPVGRVGFAVCAKCSHCKGGLEYRCKHPCNRLRTSRMNPVTGLMVYKNPEDVGMYTSSSPYPGCYSVNPEGYCALFKRRRTVWQVIMDWINPSRGVS
jgi:hypothetical protein